jgi:hypothetical protein
MIAIPRLVMSGIDRDCLGVNVTVDVQVYKFVKFVKSRIALMMSTIFG